jgi:serine/threonine-protein kinase RsbW
MIELSERRNTLDQRTVEIILPSQLGYERVAMGSAAAFASFIGFLPERIEDLKTAVGEAFTNAVQHGNRGHKDARVSVSMSFKDSILHISVFDEGEGFKKEPKDPDIVRIIDNLDPPVGFGVYLMKMLVDEFEFKKLAHRPNEVRMAMRLRK